MVSPSLRRSLWWLKEAQAHATKAFPSRWGEGISSAPCAAALPAFLRWRFAIQMGHEGNPHALTGIPESLRAHGGCPMDFYAILDQVIALLRQRQRVTYRALKVQFQLDDEALEALKEELIEAQHFAADEAGRILVWIGDAGTAPPTTTGSAPPPGREPLTYTPPY